MDLKALFYSFLAEAYEHNDITQLTYVTSDVLYNKFGYTVMRHLGDISRATQGCNLMRLSFLGAVMKSLFNMI